MYSFWTITICSVLLGLSSFLDKIPDYSNYTILKKSQFKIPFFLGLSILSIWATQSRDDASKADQKATEAKNARELFLLDSLHKVHDDSLQHAYAKQIDTNYKESIKIFSEVLLKYNLKYSADQQKVTSYLKDSISKEIPSVAILDVGSVQKITADSLVLTIPITNTGNCPVKITYAVYLGFEAGGQLGFLGKTNKYNGDEIAQGRGYTDDYRVYYQQLPDKLFYYFKGFYSTSKGLKKTQYEPIVVWDIKRKSVSIVGLVSLKDSLLRFFNRN